MNKNKSLLVNRETRIEEEDLPIIGVNNFNQIDIPDFTSRLLSLDSDPTVDAIFLYITSFGGDAYSLLAMVDLIKACNTPVHTVGLGICASAGGILLSSGTGERWLGTNSFLHIHRLQCDPTGDVPSLENDLKHSKELETTILTLLANQSKMTVKGLKEKLYSKEKEWYMNAKEAKRLGFIDNIGIPIFKKQITVGYK